MAVPLYIMPTDTPAQLVLSAIVITNLKDRRGRSPKCLLSTFRRDMDKVGLYMHNIKGLEELHKHAADKQMGRDNRVYAQPR